jgi:hypothetical protein
MQKLLQQKLTTALSEEGDTGLSAAELIDRILADRSRDRDLVREADVRAALLPLIRSERVVLLPDLRLVTGSRNGHSH